MRKMDPATWLIVSPLFDRALDLAEPARQQLLAEVREAHPAAADLLEALLSSHQQLLHSNFLQPLSLDTLRPSLAGTQVGAYTLTSPLGAGGMGAVWKAYRSDGRFKGEVAIKLLHLAILTSGGEARFTLEGTMLARLSHPNIARLLDAGVTSTGQPYLVLECVDGVRIDRYADDRRLDVRARIALMRQVVDAVSHAHAHLIVHRDLKPSNILVDASGQVKLLDFGVATLLVGEHPGETVLTGHALTPEYAAPEQIRGDAVTTAADIYGLGVILYRLLAVAHPTGEAAVAPHDHARATVERDPLSLVAALSARDTGERARIAAARSTTPDRLRRTLAGDLDGIVAKALAKDPAGRYATAMALGDDLGRVLRDEPVAARPQPWTYRAWRFVRRHRAAVAAAAMMVATLAAATIVTTNRMLEARKQRDRAEFQARRAEASSEFMRYLVTQIGTTPMTMREVLDRGRMALDRQYAGDPAFAARMLMQLSGPYIELGDYKTSAMMMTQALEIARTLDDPDLLAASHCGRAVDLVEERDFEGARRHIAEGATHAARAFSPGLNAECATGETRLAMAERRYDDAVRHASRAVQLLEEAENTTTTRYTSALSNLGNAYSSAGRRVDALTTHRRVTEVSRLIGRGETVGVVASLQNEAVSLRMLGRWMDADQRFTEAVSLARGIDRSGRVPAAVLLNHARTLALLDRGNEAMDLLGRGRGQGELSPSLDAFARLVEAQLLVERGDVEGARKLHDSLNHPDSPLSAAYAHVVPTLAAQIARAEGRIAEARSIIDGVIEVSKQSPALAYAQPEILEYAARLAIEGRDLETAIRLTREAIGVADAEFGTASPSAHAGRARLTLGIALAMKGLAQDAKTEYQRAAADLEQTAGGKHPWTAEARARLTAAIP
jgi:eukaryotic-like serine/threonine-protein kinase